MTPEQDIRETTEMYLNLKFSDQVWEWIWSDLLTSHDITGRYGLLY